MPSSPYTIAKLTPTSIAGGGWIRLATWGPKSPETPTRQPQNQGQGGVMVLEEGGSANRRIGEPANQRISESCQQRCATRLVGEVRRDTFRAVLGQCGQYRCLNMFTIVPNNHASVLTGTRRRKSPKGPLSRHANRTSVESEAPQWRRRVDY